MLVHLAAAKLLVGANWSDIILVFFTYSLLGFVMECIVLSIQERRLVTNRGFAMHLPFCIIYGFGAILGYVVLHPFRDKLIVLFVVGALGASVFEYFVARLQIRLFGDFWWDYTQKPFNYKGILCLESTLGWGVVALVVILVLHGTVLKAVNLIPDTLRTSLAVTLVLTYSLDFFYSAWAAKSTKNANDLSEDSMRHNNTGKEVNEWNWF